jgi:predicted dehydrogenase
MTRKLRLAFVGCGAVTELHLMGLRDGAPEIEVTAAVDPDAGRARALAAKTGARVFATLAEALEAGGFEAVDLMVPHHLHEALALEALRAGMHVLVEKPMAPTVEACARMLDAAREAGTVFMVAENAQYWPEVVAAKALIAQGAVGELLTAQATVVFPPLPEFYGGDHPWRHDRARAGGGVVVDTGSHWIRPLRMCVGEIEEVVAGLGWPEHAMEGESQAHALLRFRGGALGVFQALLTTAPVGPQPFFRFTGRRGEITIDALGRVTVHDDASPRGRRVGEPAGYFKSYGGEFADFAAAVLEARPLAAGPEEALGELRVALAMYRSADTRCWEKVWA